MVTSDSALFCCSTLSLAEVPSLFAQRHIVRRHQKGALYYPFIDGLAHTIVDVPITFISVALMSVTLYFLVGLQRSVEQFLYVPSRLRKTSWLTIPTARTSYLLLS